MTLRSPPAIGLAVALALLPCACRRRAVPQRLDGAATAVRQAAPVVEPERAGLLLVDEDGVAKLLCLPERGPPRELFPGRKLRQVLDGVGQDGAVTVAALAAASGAEPKKPGGHLVLLSPDSAPRILANGARGARFSPSGDALAFETASREHVGGGAVVEVRRSHVLELATGKIAELGEAVDPRWEADGKHLRATRLTKTIEDRRVATAVRWTSFRVRWERGSQKMETWGRGSAQIPAPLGTAVAWSEDQRDPLAFGHCAVRLGRGGHQHPIVGPFCTGLADDRGVRWSPDGQWLAFPRPGPVPGERKPGTFFIDVVGVEGGRYPPLSALYARVGPSQAAVAGAPGTIWLDWSPAQRLLAVQDGADDLRIYDFEAHTISLVGRGGKPRWSPGGGYLLVLAAREVTAKDGVLPSRGSDGSAVAAFVLPGAARAAAIDLGPVRDIRWLAAEACAGPGR
jgi:hypothetical protein